MAAPRKDDLKAKFEAAAAAAKQTRKKPDNATLLKLYSYYKQATEGDVKGERPGGFDFVGVLEQERGEIVRLEPRRRDAELRPAGREIEPRIKEFVIPAHFGNRAGIQ